MSATLGACGGHDSGNLLVLWISKRRAAARGEVANRSEFISRRAAQVVSFLNCLAGGVVLGVAFHLLAHGSEGFESYFVSQDDDVNADYPFSGLLCAASLILLIIIDRRILHSFGGHSHSILPESSTSNHDLQLSTLSPVTTRSQLLATSSNDPREQDIDDGCHCDADCADCAAGTCNCGMTGKCGPEVAPASAVVTVPEQSKKPVSDVSDQPSAVSHSLASASIFAIALSVHSLFEGLGIGAESSSTGFATIVVAMIMHKIVEALALGARLTYANASTLRASLIIIAYALVAPIGVGIGMGAQEGVETETKELTEGIFLSIAAGALFYICLIEIIPLELTYVATNRGGSEIFFWVKVAALLAGWGFMMGMAYYA